VIALRLSLSEAGKRTLLRERHRHLLECDAMEIATLKAWYKIVQTAIFSLEHAVSKRGPTHRPCFAHHESSTFPLKGCKRSPRRDTAAAPKTQVTGVTMHWPKGAPSHKPLWVTARCRLLNNLAHPPSAPRHASLKSAKSCRNFLM
jgi:hypothetical protein